MWVVARLSPSDVRGRSAGDNRLKSDVLTSHHVHVLWTLHDLWLILPLCKSHSYSCWYSYQNNTTGNPTNIIQEITQILKLPF